MGSLVYGRTVPVDWLPSDCVLDVILIPWLPPVSYREVLTQAGFSFVRVDELASQPSQEILPP